MHLRWLPVTAAAVLLSFSEALPHESLTLSGAPASHRSGSLASTAPARPLSIASLTEITETAAKDDDLADAALDAVAKHVVAQSHPDALRLAFRAYYNFKAAHPEQVRKPYLYYVDYGLDNRTQRGYVFDMEALTLVDGPFTVAHGRGSSSAREGVPSKFSNIKDSAASSLGLYLAEETYAFSGRSGGQRYHSIGLRLRGLSGRFNSAARKRGIVVHGAPYVTSRQAGRSEGCPAMEESRAQKLIPQIRNGGLVFLFSPRDPSWMRDDRWLRGGSRSLAAADR